MKRYTIDFGGGEIASEAAMSGGSWEWAVTRQRRTSDDCF